MKIAIIHANLARVGGAENLIIWYTSTLVERGYDITLITGKFDKSLWDDKYTRNLKVKLLPQVQLNRNPLLYEYFGWKTLSELNAFDLVIVHMWLNPSLISAFSRKAQPWVWFCEEPPRYIYFTEIDAELKKYWKNRINRAGNELGARLKNLITLRFLKILKWMDRMVVKRVFHHIVANSRFTSYNVEKVYGRKAIPCHLGVDRSLKKSTFKDMKSVHECKFMLLHMGRLSPPKNVERLIHAMTLVESDIDYKLIIVGDGESREKLEYLVKKHGLQDIVEFTGFVNHESVKDYFNSADLIVYLPINEPFGLVPIEGMACGKIVLGSNSGGPSEIIKDGITGFTCNHFDPKDIARKITKILHEQGEHETMRRRARQVYLSKFTLEKGVDRFERLVIKPFL